MKVEYPSTTPFPGIIIIKNIKKYYYNARLIINIYIFLGTLVRIYGWREFITHKVIVLAWWNFPNLRYSLWVYLTRIRNTHSWGDNHLGVCDKSYDQCVIHFSKKFVFYKNIITTINTEIYCFIQRHHSSTVYGDLSRKD